MNIDQIEVRGIRELGRHGVFTRERHELQPFEVDLVVVADLARAGRSDDIADTIDYGALATRVAGIISSTSFHLLEALAQHIADDVLADERALEVHVTVAKLRPPIACDLRDVRVSIQRSQRADQVQSFAVAKGLGQESPRTTYLGLGSNLGDRAGYLRSAIDALIEIDPMAKVSPVYESTPIGGPAGQGPYLNCVVSLETTMSPADLLDVAHELEARAERIRNERFGPRTLDVDILLIEGFTCFDEDLTVPHPRMWERAFVLAPLADLDLELVGNDWVNQLGGDGVVADLVHQVDVVVDSRLGGGARPEAEK